jgi:hypothetical protein
VVIRANAITRPITQDTGGKDHRLIRVEQAIQARSDRFSHRACVFGIYDTHPTETAIISVDLYRLYDKKACLHKPGNLKTLEGVFD